MAEIVGGDLYGLWRVSEVHLPRIADVFYDAGRAIGAAQPVRFRGVASSRLDVPVMPAPAGAAWEELRDELLRLYAQVGDTVLVAAAGLRRAREVFVEADLANADALRNYLATPGMHDPNASASNPP